MGRVRDAGLVKGICVQPPIVVQALAVLTARDRPTCFRFRQNRYDATITIVAIEDTWKIRSMELLQETREPLGSVEHFAYLFRQLSAGEGLFEKS